MNRLILMLSYAVFALVGVLGLATEVSARDNDLCICQTGSHPSNQVGFFRLGCRLWNAGNSCGRKLTVPESENLDGILARYPGTRSLKVGYVGHWSSAGQSVDFLRSKITPLLTKYEVSIEIDNTACLATDNPYIIGHYLRGLGPLGERVKFRGNQAISTGLWDRTLPGKHNFWAVINGGNLEVEFPSCEEFENRGCLGLVQREGRGICRDDRNNKYVTLSCQRDRQIIVMPTNTDNGDQSFEQVRYLWKRSGTSNEADPRVPLQAYASRLSAMETDQLRAGERSRREDQLYRRLVESYDVNLVPTIMIIHEHKEEIRALKQDALDHLGGTPQTPALQELVRSIRQNAPDLSDRSDVQVIELMLEFYSV